MTAPAQTPTSSTQSAQVGRLASHPPTCKAVVHLAKPRLIAGYAARLKFVTLYLKRATRCLEYRKNNRLSRHPHADYAPPRSWEQFEELCADVFQSAWRDPALVRHGRAGQRQNG